MTWIKLSNGVYAEEVENPTRVVTLAELNTEITDLQNQLADVVFLPITNDLSPEIVEAYTLFNEKQGRSEVNLMTEITNRQALLSELSTL